MFQAHSGEYISELLGNITEESFGIKKEKIISITTDGGSNVIAGVESFIGNKRIPCIGHLLNNIVDNIFEKNEVYKKPIAAIKTIVKYFKHCVDAMDALRSDQESLGKKEGQVLILIQLVCTRWNSTFDMMERFIHLSEIVAKVLTSRST